MRSSRGALQVKSSWLARKAPAPSLGFRRSAARPGHAVPTRPGAAYLAPRAPRRTFEKRPCGAARFSNSARMRSAATAFSNGGDRRSPLPRAARGIVSARLYDPAATPATRRKSRMNFCRESRDRANPNFRPDRPTPTDRRGRRRRFRSRFAVRCFPSPGDRAATDDCHRDPTGRFVCFLSLFIARLANIHRSRARSRLSSSRASPLPSLTLPPPTGNLIPHRTVDRTGGGARIANSNRGLVSPSIAEFARRPPIAE